MLSKRRKVDVKCSVFNEVWEKQVLFMKHFGKPTWLICNVSVAVNKQFYIKRHYDTKHSNFFQVCESSKKKQTWST